MPSCNNSASSQNTRVFAPYVLLKQDTNRLAIVLKSGEGYSMQSFSPGDVIRYDPTTTGYVKSQATASAEQNAEVLGVVESGSGSPPYTVVVSGSIAYPTAKITAIVDGGAGGKEILFLDEAVAGGLTGTVDTASGVKIIKPVLQLAPHGGYNAIVVNYVGYKTGNSTAVNFTEMPTSTIVFGPPGLDNDVYLPLDADQSISPTESPEAYDYFGLSYGPWLEKITLTIPGSSVALTEALVTSKAQAYQLENGLRVNSGTIERVDTTNNIIWVRKGADVSAMSSSLATGVYINGYQYSLVSSTVAEFFVPKIEGSQLTQGGDSLVPYFKTMQVNSVYIPDGITCINLSVTGNLVVNSVNVYSKLAELETKINQLNGRVSAF